MSAVSRSTPFWSAPVTKRSRYASSASCERLRLIARRRPSASPTLKPASAIATSSTWSWNTTTPSVERRQSASSGWSTGGTKAGSSRRRWRCSMYGWTAPPWIGPGRTSATCTVMSSIVSGRVLGDVPRQAGDLGAERAEGSPARRLELPRSVGQRCDLVGDALRVPAVRQPREPLEVGVRQAERLADVADRAARAVRRERRDERRVLPPVALGDGDDQLLADVAREVEVDVGHRVELSVQEPPEREVGLDRVDVRETREVADDRADGAPAAATGRQDVARRRAAPYLERARARQLEHLPVQEEEAREPELVDQRELLVEPRTSPLLVA